MISAQLVTLLTTAEKENSDRRTLANFSFLKQMLDKRRKKGNDDLISKYEDTKELNQRPRRNSKKRLEYDSKTTTLQDQDVGDVTLPNNAS